MTTSPFQSPSYRGKHCNSKREPGRCGVSSVSIPFVSGQALQPTRSPGPVAERSVSIPFVSGQALQHRRGYRPSTTWFWFQSPSYRGKHCNYHLTVVPDQSTKEFQSPSYRGKHCNRHPFPCLARFASSFNPLRIGASTATASQWCCTAHSLPVSIPFVSGQALQRTVSSLSKQTISRFNPLRIGASTATGQIGSVSATTITFQSPSYRGKHCNSTQERAL